MEEHESTSIDGPFLARPQSSDGVDTDSAFSFAKASRQQMDFNGTRKGKVSNRTTISGQAEEPAIVDPDFSKAETQGDFFFAMIKRMLKLTMLIADPEEAPHIPAMSLIPDDAHDGSTMTHEPSFPSTEVKAAKRKDKSKRKRRYATAPNEQVFDGPVKAQAAQINLPVDSAHLNMAEGPAHHDYLDIGVDMNVEQRSTTPPMPEVEYEHQQYASSPHSQLQGDLQAATSNHSPSVPDPSCRANMQHAMQEMPQEPPTLVQSSPTPNHRQQYEVDDHNSNMETFQRVSDHSVPARVSKRKQKQSRRATAPAPSEQGPVDESSSDINDYLQIVAFKIQQREQAAAASLANERESLQAELQQAIDTKRMLQEELDNALQQKDSLATTVDEHHAKITAYELKVNRFKTFVDGLGKDVDSLKKDANNARRQGEQLAQENVTRRAERDALQYQVTIWAERSAQLNNQTLKACHETQSELEKVVMHNNYLDQQLSEKAGLLGEERDRRSQLEKQLTSTASSDKDLLQALKSNHDAILEQLSEVHETVKESQDHQKLSDMLQTTFNAVDGLSSDANATKESIASVKELVESMSQRYMLKLLTRMQR